MGRSIKARRARGALLGCVMVALGCAGKSQQSGVAPVVTADADNAGAPLAGQSGAPAVATASGASNVAGTPPMAMGGAFINVAGGSVTTAAGAAHAGEAGSVLPGSGAGGAVDDAGPQGDAGQREPNGVYCYGSGGVQCTPNEQCMMCNSTWLCVAKPALDPSGYALAVSQCGGTLALIAECDGPEDCPDGQYCVYGQTGRNARCSTTPAVDAIDCCLECFDGMAACTFCHSDTDCPAGQACDSPNAWPDRSGDTDGYSKGCKVIQ